MAIRSQEEMRESMRQEYAGRIREALKTHCRSRALDDDEDLEAVVLYASDAAVATFLMEP